MNNKIQVDSRMFQEFYPDSAKRHQVHYTFAHKFLPNYVQRNPYAFFSYLFRKDLSGCPMEPTRFIHSRWTIFEENANLIPKPVDPINGDIIFRRVAELTMSIHEVDGRPVALVQMPKPEKQALAFLVAVVLLAPAANPENWPRDVQARVFTLEAEDPQSPQAGRTGVFCEWTKAGEHKNFGSGVPLERDAFLKVVLKVLQAPNPKAAGSFNTVSKTITFNAAGKPPPPPQPPPTIKKPWWKIG
jgi:hypothetical protein